MLTDTAPPENRDAEYLPEATDFLERHFTMAEQELLDMRWPSRQLATADAQAHAIKHNFALTTWRKRNAGNRWVLVCEWRLKRGTSALTYCARRKFALLNQQAKSMRNTRITFERMKRFSSMDSVAGPQSRKVVIFFKMMLLVP
ncbi:hypothetical protein XU18_0237 [Perkinsela sp. CCAP 1560/4]|nr:hypothetical protein XU18_0237 [Perkinsela sp. CCAP 1560/4]|eukprot:KNH09552.1 hypothetical protein XU18_0237 [Perkinsela sp. CCAP 1560/4]